jgi:hypothetical protein
LDQNRLSRSEGVTQIESGRGKEAATAGEKAVVEEEFRKLNQDLQWQLQSRGDFAPQQSAAMQPNAGMPAGGQPGYDTAQPEQRSAETAPVLPPGGGRGAFYAEAMDADDSRQFGGGGGERDYTLYGPATMPPAQNGEFTALAESAEPSADYAATGLASVQLNIPKRGVVYYFRAPRGEVEITAQAVHTTTIERVSRTLIGVLVGGLILLAIRRRRARSSRRARQIEPKH